MGWTIPVQPTAYTPQIATDATGRTITTIGPVQFSAAYSVPANDPQVGSVYILLGWGTVNHTASCAPLIAPQIFGTTLTGVDPTIGGGGAGSYTVDFMVQAVLIMTAVGASGSVTGVIQANAAETGTGLSTGNVVIIPPTAVNTTVASTFQFLGSFGSVASSPSMTMNASVYERDGPGAVAA
jgi:hypothetical protein